MNLETNTDIGGKIEKTLIYPETQKKVYFLAEMIKEIDREIELANKELSDSNKDKEGTEKYIEKLTEIRESMEQQENELRPSSDESSGKEDRPDSQNFLI